MADFCRQCLQALGVDASDFDKLIPNALARLGVDDSRVREWRVRVLCEGCGIIEVDVDGRCVSADCPKHGASA